MSDQLNVIISERRADDDPARRKFEQDLARRLSEMPQLRVAIVPHLYDLPADGAAMRHLRDLTGDLVVFSWLYPRAAFWVLDANQVSGRMGRTSFLAEEEMESDAGQSRATRSDRTIWCIDLRSRPKLEAYLDEVEQVLQTTGRLGASVSDVAAPIQLEEPTVYRWYPVIDYRRCGGCLECLNFCLFGVFGLGESQQPIVEQPDACRDGCPACSRICPAQAIMFPQHEDGRIAGNGHTVAAQAPKRESPGRDRLDRLVDGLDEMQL
jgi:NAD-dependent dihydropyrimidine dehydrogenase PreA subunit